jgi:hypothetical protein
VKLYLIVALFALSLLLTACDQKSQGLAPKAIEAPSESLCLNSKAHEFIIQSIAKDTKTDLERNDALKVFETRVGKIATLDVTPTYYVHICDVDLGITLNDAQVQGTVRYEIMETSFARVGLKPDLPSYRTEFDGKDKLTYAVAAYKRYIDWYRDEIDRTIYR